MPHESGFESKTISTPLKNNRYNYNIKPFNGNDFESWEVRIITLLDKNGVLEVLEADALKAGGKRRSGGNEFEEWKKNNSRVKSFIIQHIADSHLSYVTSKQTAKEVWEALSSAFEWKI